MICPKCGNESLESSRFCTECGNQLQTPNTSIIEPKIEQDLPVEDELSTNETQTNASLEPSVEENEIKQQDEENPHEGEEQDDKSEQLEQTAENVELADEQPAEGPPTSSPKGIWEWVTLTMGGMAILFASSAAFFSFWNSDDNPREISQVIAKEPENDTQLEAIYMQQDEIIIYPNRMQHIDYYVYPENADSSGLTWESSNPQITVNPSGYVTSSTENISGDITLKNLDGSIKTTTKVKVGNIEDSFYATLDYINNNTESNAALLDYQKEQFQVGSMHDSSELENGPIKIFNEIEKNIESYIISQKQFTNKETNNLVDVDIYTHPTTNEINKIVAIEYLDNEQLGITDFYYKNGAPAFYFNRIENYYRPVAARQDFEGVRAFLHNDALIRYREIVRVGSAFEKTDYSFDDEKINWKVYEYQDIDKDDVNKEKSNYIKPGEDSTASSQRAKQYRVDEQIILNAANNIYRAVIEQPDIMKVSGYIAHPNNSGAQNITVKIFSEKFKLLVGETVTDANGYYELNVPMGQGDYRIFTHPSSYRPTTIYAIDSNQGISNAMQETIYLFNLNDRNYVAYLNLVDALSGTSLIEQLYEASGSYGNAYDEYNDTEEVETIYKPIIAQIFIRNGINNKTGSILHSYEVDVLQISEIELALDGGNYTVEVVLNGYERNYMTLSTIESGMRIQSNIVPKIKGNEVRIVLNWSHTPSDLDSHLFFPNNSHIAYYQPEYSNNFLDVDHTSGYGPETITINNLSNGTYKYYVADFTNLINDRYSSYELSNSFASVDVYTKHGLKSFHIPRNQSAVIWQVFNISNGQIIPIQRLYNNVEDNDWWKSAK